ncbi:MAG: hypothetical protein IJW18_05740 [Lachnospiraceae bacterium]|nr:hypothetical protein [Lachnospiraceae bacterium]
MRKFNKIAITLAAAAMFAFGLTSTAMASGDTVIGAWQGNDDDGWTATDINGNAIKRGWAISDSGVWYYFSNGYMVADEFINYKGDTYYLGEEGAMHTGWIEFDSDSDVDTALNQTTIDGQNVFGEDTPYEDSVWMYFNPNGSAVTDDWFEDNSGLWYYFDDYFMICDTYATKINNKIYGFSGHGNMHVGWVQLKNTVSEGEGPAASTTTKDIGWVYYANSGEMASNGWNKLGNEWTYFVSSDSVDIDPETDGIQTPYISSVAGSFMVSDTYVDDYFIDCDGFLVGSGEITFAKNYTFYASLDDFKAGNTTKLSSSKTIYFEDGIRTAGPQNNSYYFDPEVDTIYEIEGSLDRLQNIYNTVQKTASYKAEKLFNTFYVDEENNVFYYDLDGNIVKNDVVDFGGVMVAFNSSGKAVTTEGKTKIGGTYYNFSEDNGYIKISDDLIIYGATK